MDHEHRETLGLRLGSFEAADGLMARIWCLSERFYVDQGRRGIPITIWQMARIPVVILELGLAEQRGDEVRPILLEQVWGLPVMQSVRGKRSAAARAKKYGSSQPGAHLRTVFERGSKIPEPRPNQLKKDKDSYYVEGEKRDAQKAEPGSDETRTRFEKSRTALEHGSVENSGNHVDKFQSAGDIARRLLGNDKGGQQGGASARILSMNPKGWKRPENQSWAICVRQDLALNASELRPISSIPDDYSQLISTSPTADPETDGSAALKPDNFDQIFFSESPRRRGMLARNFGPNEARPGEQAGRDVPGEKNFAEPDPQIRMRPRFRRELDAIHRVSWFLDLFPKLADRIAVRRTLENLQIEAQFFDHPDVPHAELKARALWQALKHGRLGSGEWIPIAEVAAYVRAHVNELLEQANFYGAEVILHFGPRPFGRLRPKRPEALRREGHGRPFLRKGGR